MTLSVHARNTNTEPLGIEQLIRQLHHPATNLFQQPSLVHQIQRTTSYKYTEQPPWPATYPISRFSQNNVLATPRRRAQIHIGAKLSRPKLPFFTTNPRALQYRNTEDFWLPRSFAKTVRIVQDFQTTAFPDQSDAAAEAERYALADLLF